MKQKQAGASSMWASCCGLLNEVMGTGVVRGQQPGFGAGAGPFRFAPNAGYSTYPPPSSGNAGVVCKACGLDFSVFRKKHVCCDCKKNFCSLCSALQENLWRCSTCNVLKETAFQRPQLMRLKVKDLRQYLMLRNIPTETCREKEDLVDLVLCHHGSDAEDDLDTSSLHSSRSVLATPRSTLHSTPSQSSLSASPGDQLSQRGSSGTANQERGDEASLLNLESNENVEPQATPRSRKRARASLSDISTMEDIEGLNVRQLKEILARNFVNYSGCCEKWELVERVNRLYRETEENRKSLENVDNSKTAVVTSHPQPICSGGNGDDEKMHLSSDDNLCRICMDAVIDCVLLECGHMVTCTKCGKRMSECPICRQYVVRAVHVFKS